MAALLSPKTTRTLRRLLFVIPAAQILLAAITANPPKQTKDAISANTLGRGLLSLDKDDDNNTCVSPSIDSFPPDFFTQEERLNGGVVVHIIISIYIFILLAKVCDEFFVPSLERLCDDLDMIPDVAGATFMAAATSAPEFFTNIVGTFVTKGDLGIGTILGSAVFNILAVAACCGLATGMTIPLDWWPMTRDSFYYGVSVLALFGVIYDGKVWWYEALILVGLYVIYIIVMVFNTRLGALAHQVVETFSGKKADGETSQLLGKKNKVTRSCYGTNSTKVGPEPNVVEGVVVEKTPVQTISEAVNPGVTIEDPKEDNEDINHPFLIPDGTLERIWWVITWPIIFILYFTIPDCRRKIFKMWYPLTFTMCVVYIGTASYVAAWMITVIGYTFSVPDSVMGLTFLAAGTSVPEAVSSIIVSKQGQGSMGISNSIGSNTFDILVCLGVPWLIKASFLPSEDNHYIQIDSSGLTYIIITLLTTLIILYVTFLIFRFRLNRRVGAICLITYVVFLVVASLIETNTFFYVHPPTCDEKR